MAEQAPLMVISSDGHALAPMAEYRPYLEERYLSTFDEFLREWKAGYRNHDLALLEPRLDPQHAAQWKEHMVDTGRIDNYGDPANRLDEMDREGVAAEVLFSDFGLPFELWGAVTKPSAGSWFQPGTYQEHKAAGMRAYNRWVANFISHAPERWAALATISWQQDPAAIVSDIRQAHANGLTGLTLPVFDRERPLYHPDFAPVWNVVEELGMVVHSHSGMSASSGYARERPYAHPHPAIEFRLMVNELVFFTQNILSHLIWGGVLDAHPSLQVVFTEQSSFWVIPALEAMDYTYVGSYFRTDYKDIIRSKPSEYFARQCHLGSSLFTQAEIAARHTIGVDKMMLGCDLPHHEGTLIESTRDYLQATLGAEGVPVDEARRLLAYNAAEVYGFDVGALEPVAARLNVRAEDVLSPPERNLYPYGDAHKPLSLT